ncbi:winged helix DNA-binding domain-containing protein [Bacteroides sp.]
MMPSIRLVSQQLLTPRFDKPGELVSWLGAVQAQEVNMAKWALGIRLKSGTLQAVNEALARGEILRTHVMRPTWHFVAAEDIRWMLKLSAHRIKSANDSYAKGRHLEFTESLYSRSNALIERMLEGNRHLTKQEIEAGLLAEGIAVDDHRITRFIARAEQEGIVCSGIEKDKKQTYALLEERVPRARELTKEEALATLAGRYFRSHSPATLADFVWWSGLSVTEARQAIGLIQTELIAEQYDSCSFFVHESCSGSIASADTLHLLPSFDEYLIGYKDRTAVLAKEHYPKAFNRWGIFYPVVLYNGKVVGNWSRSVRKASSDIELSFFEHHPRLNNKLIERAKDTLNSFYRE